MTTVDLHMKLFGWFYRWKTMRDSAMKLKIRPRTEIVTKKQEFQNRLLLAEKSNRERDIEKYKNYLEVMKWMLKE